MNPNEKGHSRLYCNFKVHKQNEHKEVPPVRAIISGAGSVTENISLFVDLHFKDVSVKSRSEQEVSSTPVTKKITVVFWELLGATKR